MSEILTISLLHMLSKAELTALGKYLKSPFFSNKKHLPVLFDTLRNAGARVAEVPEAAYERVFSGEPFDQHRWNKALSDLNGCIRDFLAVQHFQQHPEWYPLLEATALQGRDHDALFQRATRTLLDQKPGSDTSPDKTECWWVRFQAYKLAGTHPRANRMKWANSFMTEMENALDTYYYLSKLQFACNHLTSERVYQKTPEKKSDFRLLLQQAEYIRQKGSSPLLHIYCLLTSLLGEYGAQFKDFYEALIYHKEKLSQAELAVLIAHGYNYCVSAMRKGQQEALDWHLKLISLEPKEGVPQGEDLFLNLAVTFAKAGKKADFDSLVSAQLDVLPEERREEALTLLVSCWHFYQGDYQKAQSELIRINTRHPRYTLMWHSLAVRNAFMLLLESNSDDTEQVELALDRFSDFLDRQKVYAKAFCQSFVDLIWCIRFLCKTIKQPNLKKEALLIELKKREPASREWITSVLNRLPDC